jgi:HAD superfamily hydrolase (TIGR01549 family)
VALDFAPIFEARIRDLTQRRDRLAHALEASEVAPSQANFLYVAPDPAARLREVGQLVRTLPGTSAARVGVGTEAIAGNTAEALGGRLEPPRPGGRRRLLVLDVDGVLIDADRSFMDAVNRALAELMPGISWSDDHFQAFKRTGGFNNDFRLTAAAWALAQAGQLDRVFSAEGVGFPDFEAQFEALESEAQSVVQRHYADTCKQERPLIDRPELAATGFDLAILTGRPPEELLMAFEVLGWQLPAISDAGPHLRKPEPAGLLQLADAFRAEEIIFVGDTRDDAEALRRARAVRPELIWTFGAVGPDRKRFAAPEDVQAATLRDLLPMLMLRK